MVDKQEIIFLYHREGRSLRDISRTLHLNRETVTKVVREYEASLKSENPEGALNGVLVTEPRYKAFLVNMSGASYRVKGTQKRLNALLK